MHKGVQRWVGRVWLLFALTLLPVLSLLAPAAPAASETPICQQTLPEPASGTFTLDRTSLRPGERTIGIVSGLASWPVHLFGGSGETFEACVPGAAFPRVEVMAHDNAAYFLVPITPSLPAHNYQIGLLFYEGGQPLSGGRLVRFNAALTVTAHPTPVSGITPACQQTHPAATTGGIAGPGGALTGTPITAAVRGLDPRWTGGLNEYDRLDYIACLAGQATPITDLRRSDSPFEVPVPADLASGRHSLVVIGLGAGGLVTWRIAVLVLAHPELNLSPNPAPAGSWLSVSGNCAAPQSSASLISAAFDNSGQHDFDGTNGVWQFPGKGSAGSFSGRVLLKSTASGAYHVTMRCGGGLAGGAVLTVQPVLAVTGRAVLPSVVVGGLSLLLGLALVAVARPRPGR